MPKVAAKSPLEFTLLWTVGTFGGFVGSLFWIEIGERPDIGVVQAAVGGLAIALPQSLILNHTIFTGKWIVLTLAAWVFLTATGVGAVGWMVLASEVLPLRLYLGMVYGAFAGFSIGMAQWLAIRQPASWAWQWILANAVSWAIAVPLGSVVGMILHQLTRLFLGEVVGLAITWLVVAISTGIYAYKLLYQSW
ncbi:MULTISPECIES: hypothetical protein [unclassified Anabaena]|uniref:hypothetical protein n=1 Tax=unclassified Anabaena TaxID=2619674 RepID=UPI00082E894D|nr:MULTISPECIES: hypothetical protein [unclassified Anabaena]